MSDRSGKTDLRQHLEALEQRFAEALNYLTSRGPLPEHHQAKVDEFEERKAAIRARLAAEGHLHAPAGADAKREIKEDLEKLMGSFERWVEHVDKEFNQAR